jgi:hypothetical protein
LLGVVWFIGWVEEVALGEDFGELVEAELQADTGFLLPPLLHRVPFSVWSFNASAGQAGGGGGECVLVLFSSFRVRRIL